MWTLRIDNGGRVSGIGLGDDGEESLLGFRADRIYFAHPNSGDEVFPMVLDGGSVVMNDALINKLLFTKLRSSDDSLVFQNGKLQAEYIAVDDLVVRQGQSSNYLVGQRGWRLTTTGGEINFPIQFNNVQGAGALAGLDSVGYGDLTGAKPPTNADHTGSNTAFDTSRVAGTAASTVRDRANAGNNANSRVNNWTRPDSTLIDGNKIFTGDAYVDTLQIKGDAVTVPILATFGGRQFGSSSNGIWFPIMQNATWTTLFSIATGRVAPGNGNVRAMLFSSFDLYGDSVASNYGFAIQVRIVNRATGAVLRSGSKNINTNVWAEFGLDIGSFGFPYSGTNIDFQYRIGATSYPSGSTGEVLQDPSNVQIRGAKMGLLITKR